MNITRAIRRSVTVGAVAALGIIVPAGLAGAASSHQKSEFLSSVHALAPSTTEYSNSGITKIGSLVCGAFEDGATVTQVLDVYDGGGKSGLSDHAFVVIVGAGVKYLCPSQRTQVMAQIREAESTD